MTGGVLIIARESESEGLDIVGFGRKGRDGQTRNGFPLVRCKKGLASFFVADFFAVGLVFLILRLRDPSSFLNPTHWMRQIGLCV